MKALSSASSWIWKVSINMVKIPYEFIIPSCVSYTPWKLRRRNVFLISSNPAKKLRRKIRGFTWAAFKACPKTMSLLWLHWNSMARQGHQIFGTTLWDSFPTHLLCMQNMPHVSYSLEGSMKGSMKEEIFPPSLSLLCGFLHCLPFSFSYFRFPSPTV